MAGKEDEVAARERRGVDILVGAERGELQVAVARQLHPRRAPHELDEARAIDSLGGASAPKIRGADHLRSEEHTSELQSLMRISYAVFCLKKKKNKNYSKIHTNNK